MKKITLYTSKNCGPCEEIAELLKNSEYASEVEIVDIETDEGFERFSREVLDHGNGAVPAAYREGQKCQILLTEEDQVIFNCPGDPPAGQPD